MTLSHHLAALRHRRRQPGTLDTSLPRDLSWNRLTATLEQEEGDKAPRWRLMGAMQAKQKAVHGENLQMQAREGPSLTGTMPQLW